MSRRLTLFYVAVTAVLLVMAAAYLYWTQAKNLDREDRDFLLSKIEDCRRVLQRHVDASPLLINEIQTEAAANRPKYYERLLDGKGRALLETPGMDQVVPISAFPQADPGAEIPEETALHRATSRRFYLLMSALATEGEVPSGGRLVQVALDVTPEQRLLSGYRRKLAAVVLFASALSWLMGAFVTRKGLQPLQDITRATERVTAKQLHERVLAHGWPDELAALARSFDNMLDRLEESFTRLSQFSADLAHELRTPINNLRGEAGVALSHARSPEEYRQTLESSLEEYARLARLIDNMLFLARADGPAAGISRVATDARRATDAVREFYDALAEDRGVEVRCEGQATVCADPVLFRQAVSNLLSNALNYTPRGGRVLIRLNPLGEGGLEVSVADGGCGIAAEHLPKIFDRLYRVDSARTQHPNGSGLGLAIVKSIMTLHGGAVDVQSQPGQGSRFTLRFPPGPVGE